MAAHLRNPDFETTQRLELRALEQMLAALCEQIEQWIADARRNGADRSRETALQIEAFAERRTQALNALNDARPEEPYEVRITRLEKLVWALDCSKSFFRDSDPPGR